MDVNSRDTRRSGCVTGLTASPLHCLCKLSLLGEIARIRHGAPPYPVLPLRDAGTLKPALHHLSGWRNRQHFLSGARVHQAIVILFSYIKQLFCILKLYRRPFALSIFKGSDLRLFSPVAGGSGHAVICCRLLPLCNADALDKPLRGIGEFVFGSFALRGFEYVLQCPDSFNHHFDFRIRFHRQDPQ